MWLYLEEKLNKSGRKWKPSNYLEYRYAELFCEECGKSLGILDIVDTNLETNKFCDDCAKKYIKDTPIDLPCGMILKDYGTDVVLEYKNNYYENLSVSKVCYFNKKGRYIKVKDKRYYI